jgi:hypothetical protein
MAATPVAAALSLSFLQRSDDRGDSGGYVGGFEQGGSPTSLRQFPSRSLHSRSKTRQMVHGMASPEGFEKNRRDVPITLDRSSRDRLAAARPSSFGCPDCFSSLHAAHRYQRGFD